MSNNDIDSSRVTMQYAMRDLSVAEQMQLVHEWLWTAFDWGASYQGREYWRGVADNLLLEAEVKRLEANDPK